MQLMPCVGSKIETVTFDRTYQLIFFCLKMMIGLGNISAITALVPNISLYYTMRKFFSTMLSLRQEKGIFLVMRDVFPMDDVSFARSQFAC